MCRSVADLWSEELERAGIEMRSLELVDSLALQSEEELKAALTGRDDASVVPQEVRRLQSLVEECQFLIFVHPIFWFDVPTQLKGFQDSVLSSGFAFRKLPGHPMLNRAAGVIERVPIVRVLMRRYAAYGLLRDKSVFVSRTQGGPEAGLGIFGHEATSLESALQFCGARLVAVDKLAELDDTSEEDLRTRVLPGMARRIQAHCKAIAQMAVAQSKTQKPRAILPPHIQGLAAA